jgi:microcystin-dependent protein
MATIFPTSPAPQVNDEYQGYRYNGTTWDIIGVDLTAEYQPRVASVSNTELGYLDGVTSSIQTQLGTKTPLDSPTFTGTVTIPAGASISGYATETYVGTAISNLIDTAPGTLDTLNELAAALGDDPNFATTITNLIAEKMSNVPGMISQYGGATAPTGWFLCEGQEVSIATYTSLYNALTATGTVFPYGANTNGSGGAGSTHFRLPNLKGRIPVGRDSTQTEFDTLGETGGSKTSVAPHTHGIDHDHASFGTTDGAGNHNHPWTGVNSDAGISGSGGNYPFRIFQDIATNWGGTQSSMGGAGAHNHTIDVPNFTGTSAAASAAAASGNLQPYVVINYIIRY